MTDDRAHPTALMVVVALLLSGCAPVGPNFERPAAIVSPQFKEIAGWKIATPRANEPKGAWWSVFHDSELDQLMRVVVVSNQTVKADEANYREALALIRRAPASFRPSTARAPRRALRPRRRI
jgi:outer membrane protein TolC